MKKLFFIGVLSLYSIWLFPQYMTLKGNQLYDSTGAPFYVKGVNYDIDLYNATNSLTGITLKPAAYYYKTTRPTYYKDSAGIKDIGADFRFIRDSLGCNTIRLCVGLAFADSCGSTAFRIMIRLGNGDSIYWPCLTSGTLTFMTPYYQALLDTAAACKVKIVLLLWSRGASCFGSVPLEGIYSDYLTATALALTNKKALLAYDEWNEPELSSYGNLAAKSTVCSHTQTWYHNLKSHDPNHLVTVGLWGPDVYNYGIDVYAADFYAMHLYYNTNKAIHYLPNSTNYVVDSILDYNNVGAYTDRFNTFARMMANASGRYDGKCKRPPLDDW